MASAALTLTQKKSEGDWPARSTRLQIVVEVDLDNMPDPALRRHMAEELQELAAKVALGDGELQRLDEGEQSPGELAAQAATWSPPEDLHMKSGKAAHRFLAAAAELAEAGMPPTTQEVAEKAGMSLPPVYRYIDPETPAGAYLAPLIHVEKRGRSYTIDVTALGRLVAKRVKEGSLPS